MAWPGRIRKDYWTVCWTLFQQENYEADVKKYEYNKHDDDPYRANPHKKKKSFLDGMFDF